MQGVKALMGMRKCTHSIWCWCSNDGPDTLRSTPASTWAEVRAWYDAVGCEMKSLDDLCELAHYSKGVLLGGAFTPINCRLCGYNPTEAKWRADLAAFHKLSDAEQTAARDRHNEIGVSAADAKHRKHLYSLLYSPPSLHLPMRRVGADMLHLAFLNGFKQLFSRTIHEGLPGALLLL